MQHKHVFQLVCRCYDEYVFHCDRCYREGLPALKYIKVLTFWRRK